MEVPVIVQSATPINVVLRDRRIEHQQLTGKLVMRDHRGVLLGTYDPRANETRDKAGRVVGRGNLLGNLLLMEPW